MASMSPNSTAATVLCIMIAAIFFNCVTSHPAIVAVPINLGKCPQSPLNFGVCGSWLGLVEEVIGTKPSEECCSLVKGIADLEAAVCLCSAIKANVLGVVKLKVPVAITLLLNGCGKKVPKGFSCS
ncbi:putative lipid-binding protein [Tripterygium wilfordii]|uniref:Putative lipid-binding protein n=1 Tax=Tripterygium wilfordii TaxID=458696 RepID=A0A7J7CBU2_TRIWF|nr:putative lipid-binding protein At4g00165 [Tripterygium wilfordii]KAF5731641.1 putative lipid-binding protein [Tripterygium wilfordii]